MRFDKLTYFKWVYTGICLPLIGLTFFLGLLPASTLLFVVFITNVLIVYNVRGVQPLMIISLFMLTYQVYLFPYYLGNTTLGFHTQYYDRHLFNKILAIHSVFLLTVLNCLSSKLQHAAVLIKDLLPVRKNWILFSALAGILCLILVTSKGDNILGMQEGSYDAYIENLDKQGGTWEYFYIFYTLAFLYASDRFKKLIMVGIFAIYCYLSLIRGYRIQMIQMFLLFFTLFVDGRFKTKIILVMTFVGLITVEVYGIMKELGGKIDISMIKDWLDSKDGAMLTNQTEVFYSSAAFLGVIGNGTMGIEDRLLSTLGFFENIFVPSTYVIKQGRVPEFVAKYTDIGGGGYVSVYFYLWFGLIGVVVLGLLIGGIFNIVIKQKPSNYVKVALIIIIATTPRWFAYDPANFLFRMPLYTIVFYGALSMIDKYLLEKIGRVKKELT
jgi:hypothetical protein